MRQRNLYLFVILCWLCTYGSPVQAQDAPLHAVEEAISNYNYQQAIDLIGRLDSLSPDLQRKKLAAYKELNRYGEAVRLLDEMIEADSLNMNLYIERANCYLMQNSDNKALEEYGKALKLSPENTYIRTKWDSSISATNNTQKRKPLPKRCFPETPPSMPCACWAIATENGTTGFRPLSVRTGTGKGFVGLCGSAPPVEPVSGNGFGRCSDPLYRQVHRTGFPESACQASQCFRLFPERTVPGGPGKYRNLSQLGDNTANTNYYLGLCYLKNDSLQKAYECLDKANKKAKEKNPQILTYLGIAAIEMPGYATEGIEATEKAIQLILPDSTLMFSLYNTLAKGFVMRRELKEEIVALKTSLSYSPQSSVTLNHIAYAYDLLKDNKNAVKYYKLFLNSISRREKLSGYMQKLKEAAEERLQYYREEEFFKGT